MTKIIQTAEKDIIVDTRGLDDHHEKRLEIELRRYPNLIGFKVKPYLSDWLERELNLHIASCEYHSSGVEHAGIEPERLPEFEEGIM